MNAGVVASVIAGCATEGFPADADHASICAYFLVGIELGIRTAEEANAWAYGLIEALDAPPIEIIEIATSHDQFAALDALEIGARTANWQQAGCWLLSDIGARLVAGEMSVPSAIWKSIAIGAMTDLSRELWVELSLLEDEVDLISSGIVSAQQLQDNLLQVLKRHGAMADGR
ncbi:hypothetical protein [Stenotrophomonas sp. PS02289]|uniref:hypothetical protein n=1 Tax=Stenotrophomonas sp. PS02289 TaxID=2991422 RepID=UPI00249ACB40|nr:hypothetical protein [Stenotrophomonas sp. PS02289]